jgi:PHD/YefM family antitoxin component YafN of YafNO toxin-antitoxin module
MSTLTITGHAAIRMAQRAIRVRDAELIVLIGTEVEDGYLVREKDYQQVERTLKELLNRFRLPVGKRLVVADGTVVTVYHATRRQQRRLLRRFGR